MEDVTYKTYPSAPGKVYASRKAPDANGNILEVHGAGNSESEALAKLEETAAFMAGMTFKRVG